MNTVTIAVFTLGLALILVVAAFVAAPLFGAPQRLGDESPGDRERWERQKRQALLAIREAEMDFEMGTLSPEDLESMRARFEAQALEAIAALERLGATGPRPLA
jgi:hypothetical protein